MYPSPEFLNSLSFIKKFYPLPFGARAKFRKGNHETEAIGRHSERIAKESSDTNNLKQLQGIKINSTETDHASMPLGVFASELIPDVGMAMPTYFDFASKSVSRKTNLGGVGTPPYGAAKKLAFTLAEVLITLGIIGVVAAMTLPTVIQNYQKQETVTRLKSTYSILNQVYKISIAENGEPENWIPVGEISVEEYFNKYFKPYIKILKMCETYKDCGYKTQTPWIMLEGSQSQTSIGKYDNWVTCVLPNGTVILYMSFINENHAETTHTIVDLNGAKGPNRFGRDVFRFDRIKNIGFVPSGYNSANIDCTKTTSGAGCAAKIMKDNWQISDDYPW